MAKLINRPSALMKVARQLHQVPLPAGRFANFIKFCRRQDDSPSAGVTLLELVVASAILILAATLIIGGFSIFRRSTLLNRAAEDGVSLLAEARARTLGSTGARAYGVRFEAGRMALFAMPYTEVEAITLPAEVEIYAATGLPGCAALPCDVTFVRLTGAVANAGATAGAVTFRLKSDTARTKTLTIQPTGVFGL